MSIRWVGWLLGLFVLAVAAALALRLDSGDVIIITTKHRVELSLNLVVFLALLGFIIFYLLLRFTVTVIRLPEEVRSYHVRKRRDKAHVALIEALRAFFEGRFDRAEKTAVTVMELEEMNALGAVLAGRAAHELRRFKARDDYLARVGKVTTNDIPMRVVTQTEMLLEQRRFQEALLLLKALPSKHTAALRLELKAQQQARNWEQVLTLIDQLEKRSVFDGAHAADLRRYAHAENIRRNALDRHALERYWQKLPTRLQRDSRIAVAGAECYILLGSYSQATAIIEAALDNDWDPELLDLYGEFEGLNVVGRIERGEKWLKQHPEDATLLRALGRLSMYQELWGKAQSYFEASIAVEPSYLTHLELAYLYEKLGNDDAARRHYRTSLELAMAQLKQINEEKTTAGAQQQL